MFRLLLALGYDECQRVAVIKYLPPLHEES